ncbi:3',5'-cyclic adenosine monophosphate phosphodiesterase CpdA [Polystyrenella longa]|uniref:3',5'-cyclic adenosine monophosphate phosphodiesterase CpdA n=1 Tax=Polystyrenella longa TaxID=2528007 RepID=A0A518CKE5_9PLAN|nr:metallophosphoesterase [Polystyrenella longa]QDU79691.1 3',5'-cyclic adenosine monophosphate phosphodiesterase CpdA [Polystyrenella longa]
MNHNRRSFLKNGSLFLLGSQMISKSDLLFGAVSPTVSERTHRIALVTDMHYADKEAAGSRHYRESLDKFDEAAAKYKELKPDFLVELGDIVDAADAVDVELGYLKTINAKLSQVADERHYVLGNHCVYTLTKEEFLGEVGKEKSYYSFDNKDRHFIILDACFRPDGVPYGRKNYDWTSPFIPAAELEWLEADLAATDKPTVVFTHQRLDVDNHYGANNSPAVRKVLEESGKVQAVFQGHSHKNEHVELNGIHYCVLAAMIEGSGAENNSYSTLEIFNDGTLKLNGFRKQKPYQWS